MPLIVEDGTVVENANAYCDIEFVDTYFAARGNIDWQRVPDKEAAIVLGTAYVDGKYAASWPGNRKEGRGQPLAWPRSAARDAEGNAIGSDEIPVEVKQAVCEAALREGSEPGSLSPDHVASEQVKRIREKVGELETETEFRDDAGPESAQPVLAVIDRILAPLLGAGVSSGGMVWMDRA